MLQDPGTRALPALVSTALVSTAIVFTAIVFGTLTSAAFAHGYQAGDVRIRHPFATPTMPGAPAGAVYIATLENTGTQPDRLISAQSPVAGRIEIHQSSIDAGGVMRMRETDGLPVPARASLKMRPGDGPHLMLLDRLARQLTSSR